MKLTAIEIKQQQFEKSLRGYDPSEVHSFLNLIANEWEHMVGKIRELEAQVDKMNDKLRHYERVEEALHETLQTAKNSAEEKLSSARNEARLIEERAELEAESIIQETYQKRRQIRQNILQLIDKREDMIRTIRSFLENTSETLNQFSKDDQSLFSLPDTEEAPAEEKKKKSKKDPEKKDQEPKNPPPPGSDKIDDILDEID